MYFITSLDQIITKNELNNLRMFLKTAKWNYKIPGGFLTNYPQRLVNTYGDGRYVSNDGEYIGIKYENTYWTAKHNQNNVSLETPTEPLPNELITIIPKIRQYLKNYCDKNNINENLSLHSFNIAVCNNYTEPTMNIASHTDDDYWYPKEVDNRPIFISLTFYLEENPEKNKYARFQIKINDVWLNITLEDNSIMFMNSDIYHRVLKYKKCDYKYFKPRINITLRSTYNSKTNPLLHNLCVANHTRYYKIPSAIISNGSIEEKKINDLIIGYRVANKIVHRVSPLHDDKKQFIILYEKLIKTLKLEKIASYKSNIVSETLLNVILKQYNRL